MKICAPHSSRYPMIRTWCQRATLAVVTATLIAGCFKPPADYELTDVNEARYPDTVSFTDMLESTSSYETMRATLYQVSSNLEQSLGIIIKPEDIEAVLSGTAKVGNLLKFSGAQIEAGRQLLLNRGPRGAGTPTERPYLLPQTFDMQDWNAIVTPLPEPATLLFDNVYRGWPRDPDKTDAQIHASTLFSEIIERLTLNRIKPQAERFEVIYRGTTHATPTSFIDALKANGHTVSSFVEHRVADFFGFHVKQPDGSLKPVAAAGFVKTGVKDSEGNEAILPMSHGELIFQIESSNATQGLRLDAATKFYQGTDGIGFFAYAASETPDWVGTAHTQGIGEADVVQGMSLAGLLLDIVRSVALAQNLPMEGYGMTGVCNDTVAIIQNALTGKVTTYPLVMIDELLIPELQSRISSSQGDLRRDYETLLASIEAVPSDTSMNDTTVQRALSSMPWPLLNEPFYSSQDARLILSAALQE